MKQFDRATLLRILEVQSYSRDQHAMIDLMVELLAGAGMDVHVHDGQVYGRKGDVGIAVPYFVAHADTVHHIVPADNYKVASMMMDDGDIRYRGVDPTNGDPRGIGGDDKCGLYACVIAAQSLQNVGVLITRDEEIGCVGASMVLEELLIRPGCFIQLDRRGNDDAVRDIGGPISSQAWQDAMTPVLAQYGYKWSYGSITDVGTLAGDLFLSSVNLSAGYWRPHSDNEFISETDLEVATELALHIAEVAGNEVWDIPADEMRVKTNKWTVRGKDGSVTVYTADDPYEGYNWKKRKAEPEYTLYGIDTFVDPFIGECYRQYVDSVEIGRTVEVLVPVENPHDWEFSETKTYDDLSEEGHGEVEDAVLRHWHNSVEPQLAVIQYERDEAYDVGDDADIPPSDIELMEGLQENVAGLMRDRRGHLCDMPKCVKLWFAYDITTRAWLCEEHYKEHAEDSPIIQTLTLQVAEMARKIRASNETKHQIMEMHAKDVALHEGEYTINAETVKAIPATTGVQA
jgi:hypothetical protein